MLDKFILQILFISTHLQSLLFSISLYFSQIRNLVMAYETRLKKHDWRWAERIKGLMNSNKILIILKRNKIPSWTKLNIKLIQHYSFVFVKFNHKFSNTIFKTFYIIILSTCLFYLRKKLYLLFVHQFLQFTFFYYSYHLILLFASFIPCAYYMFEGTEKEVSVWTVLNVYHS